VGSVIQAFRAQRNNSSNAGPLTTRAKLEPVEPQRYVHPESSLDDLGSARAASHCHASERRNRGAPASGRRFRSRPIGHHAVFFGGKVNVSFSLIVLRTPSVLVPAIVPLPLTPANSPVPLEIFSVPV
jgi:hypothetical protein